MDALKFVAFAGLIVWAAISVTQSVLLKQPLIDCLTAWRMSTCQ